jgi:hypothetical protein
MKMGVVIKTLVEQAEKGEPGFHPFGGGLVVRVAAMVRITPHKRTLKVTLERERVMPSNAEMDTVEREVRALGWELAKEESPDWQGYVCRRVIWFEGIKN